MSGIEYVVFFVDDEDNPEEWAASSTNFEDALHYLEVYAQDGDVGLFYQLEPTPVLVNDKRLIKRYEQ